MFAGLALMNWTIICFAYVVAHWIDHLAGYVLLILVLGTRQHALAILGHDGAHYRVQVNRRFNDFVTNCLCFFPLGAGLREYRKFHFKHHRLVGTPGDPELRHKSWSTPRMDLPMTGWQIVGYSLLDLIGGGIPEVVRLIFELRPKMVADAMGRLLFALIAVSLIYFFGGPVNLMIWLIIWFAAMATSFWAIFRLRIWTEHQGTAKAHRISAKWWQRALFVPHNTWYHYEHHRWPAVPCWNLPRMRIFDETVPIRTLDEVFDCYARLPRIKSGQPLSDRVLLPPDEVSHVS